MIVTALLQQPCNKSDNINKVVTICQQFVSRVGGGSPEKRPYDVSRGQNQYMTFPLTRNTCTGSVLNIITCN